MKKMSLQSLNISSFNLRIAILKKTLASNLHSFRKSESQLSNCTMYWNAQTNPASTVTEPLSIILKNEILKASIFYQHVDNLAEYFVKTKFVHLFKIFY